MAVKKITVAVVILILCVTNIFYYRQYFIEAWMRFTLSTQPIVITFTTTPHRIDRMQDTLRTILKQNISVPIYLSVPYHFERDNLAYKIPTWLQHHPRIHILRTKDYGPATKLLGLLQQVPLDPETIIITLDDDVYYPKNLILQLAYKAYRNPQAAIGMVGADLFYDATGQINLNSKLGYKEIDVTDAHVDVLKGYGGVAYRRKFFDDSVFTFVASQNPCLKADDIIFSYMLAKQDIPKIVLKNKFISQWNVRWQTEIGTDENALHRQHPTPVEKHHQCIAYLHELTPGINF